MNDYTSHILYLFNFSTTTHLHYLNLSMLCTKIDYLQMTKTVYTNSILHDLRHS